MRRATIEVALFVWIFFWTAGLLNPKMSEVGHFVLLDSRWVSSPWDFSSGRNFIFLWIIFWGEGLTSQIGEPQKKKWCTSIVARVLKTKTTNKTHIYRICPMCWDIYRTQDDTLQVKRSSRCNIISIGGPNTVAVICVSRWDACFDHQGDWCLPLSTILCCKMCFHI